MYASFAQWLHHFLYDSGASFGYVDVGLRTIVVYIAAIAIIKVGKRKFMGQHTGFDTLIAFILGSILSRGINGSSPLPQTIVSGFVLIFLHWILTQMDLRWNAFSRLMNGSAVKIIEYGIPIRDAMLEHGISDDDLIEAVRINGRVESVQQVSSAYLERSGRISVIAIGKGEKRNGAVS